MIHSLSPETMTDARPGDDGLTLSQFTKWLHEIEQQPAWRAKADKEMDYVAGNQLNSEILQKMREIGMPPAIEPLIGPTVDSVTGLEAKTRTDWRITSDGDDGDDVAAADGDSSEDVNVLADRGAIFEITHERFSLLKKCPLHLGEWRGLRFSNLQNPA